MATRRTLLFVIILLTYLSAGTLYATLTPPWQTPDEPAHYNYVRYLATHSGFPELIAGCYNQQYLSQLTSQQFPPHLPVNAICYEFHQPPLYYLLATPVFIISGGSLLALRLFSVLLGAGVICMAYFVGQTIVPTRFAVALGGMAFVAFVPMHVAMLSAVNNDALAELLLAAILLLLVRNLRADKPLSAKTYFQLGILLGLGLLTKATIYIAVPLIALTLLLINLPPYVTAFKWAGFFKPAAIIFGVALILAFPWYLRNINVYGGFDILGLKRHDQIVVGQLRTANFLADVGVETYASNFINTTFHSFWGQFGWMAVPMDNGTYRLIAVLVIIAVAGFCAFLVSQRKQRHLPPEDRLTLPPLHESALLSPIYLSGTQRRCMLLMASAIFFMAVAYGWYNLTFVQFQGRYLFPSLIPTGLFFSLGLHQILQRRWLWWLAGGLVLAMGGLAAASLKSGGLDKWAMLILGIFLGAVVSRAVIPRYQTPITAGLLIACYFGMALLTLLSPFWFIAPYL